jgi:gentisate 1,2-dioxygenase
MSTQAARAGSGGAAQPGSTSADRARYYERIAALGMTPLWESLHALVPPQPAPRCVPAMWNYEQIRPRLMEAGGLISAAEAVRRVLVLENPGIPGQASVTSSLYAGLQLILPGEIAPSHRHTQSALRFILEGSSAWTAVDGERANMRPGDFIITPSWTWHDHGNARLEEDGEPVVWLDGLDIPMVRFFDAGFAENHPEAMQPLARPEGASYARFGHNMLPVREPAPHASSPIFRYPYEHAREALDQLYRRGELDAWEGVKLRYVNPATGGWPMPTMATFLQFLPGGFRGRTQRGTDATVYSVVEGHGTAHVGVQSFAFAPKDVFVVPSWARLRLEAAANAVLFSYSDRPVLSALGLLREAREND